jgi:hypothetical protein
MAEEHPGEGEFKGSGDFVARLADVAAALDRIEVCQKSLRTDMLSELGKTRVDIMGKIAELQGEVAAIRDDIRVNMGAVDTVRRANDTTRDDVKQMREQLSVMYRRMLSIEADIRELKGDP